jgi:hypothetical protein
MREIDTERVALKVVRGDFDLVPVGRTETVVPAVPCSSEALSYGYFVGE